MIDYSSFSPNIQLMATYNFAKLLTKQEKQKAKQNKLTNNSSLIKQIKSKKMKKNYSFTRC